MQRISAVYLDPDHPIGALIVPSHLQRLRCVDAGRVNHKVLLAALAERWWPTTNTFHFSFGEMTMTPTDFSAISGIPFGTRPVELYDDWRRDITPERMVELIGVDVPRTFRPRATLPERCISRFQFCSMAGEVFSGYVQERISAEQAARFVLLVIFASAFWSNRKDAFDPSILRSLEDLSQLGTYDWAGLMLARLYEDMSGLCYGHITMGGLYYFWEVM